MACKYEQRCQYSTQTHWSALDKYSIEIYEAKNGETKKEILHKFGIVFGDFHICQWFFRANEKKVSMTIYNSTQQHEDWTRLIWLM